MVIKNFLRCFALATVVMFSMLGSCNTPGQKTAHITWTNNCSPSGSCTFNLYKGAATGVCSGNPTPFKAGLTATSFDDINVTQGSTVFYAVSAVNTTGESACSAEGSANVPTITAPSPGAPIITFP